MNNILSKVNARLSLCTDIKSLPLRARKNSCSALILCHFDYSCSSWYAGLTYGLKKKLQISQNKVIRFINSLGPRTRITADILSELNLLNVETRVKQLRLNHIHGVFLQFVSIFKRERTLFLFMMYISLTQGAVGITSWFFTVEVLIVPHFIMQELFLEFSP